ncbi:MAG: SIS domain-containing protein [Candidatus Aminicenantes bacterium]|nr:MAG: SIS domain-containing protein [Candidatus Aminicenantes bacterium]RPJ03312.1 MAG: SIS domain-containing protein [Candidatus Aminicenantes bacterium]
MAPSKGDVKRDADELNAILGKFLQTRGTVLDASVEAIAARIRTGGKVLAFGNGGSAAEAQHFAAELVNGLSRRGRPALPAIALTTDTSSLTAIGNDRGFAAVFSRQIEALGRPGDVALALTTSGASPNILEALKSARAAGLVTVVLTGEKGGAAAPLADFLLDVSSCATPRIQEAHLFLLHFLAEKLEGKA